MNHETRNVVDCHVNQHSHDYFLLTLLEIHSIQLYGATKFQLFQCSIHCPPFAHIESLSAHYVRNVVSHCSISRDTFVCVCFEFDLFPNAGESLRSTHSLFTTASISVSRVQSFNSIGFIDLFHFTDKFGWAMLNYRAAYDAHFRCRTMFLFAFDRWKRCENDYVKLWANSSPLAGADFMRNSYGLTWYLPNTKWRIFQLAFVSTNHLPKHSMQLICYHACVYLDSSADMQIVMKDHTNRSSFNWTIKRVHSHVIAFS